MHKLILIFITGTLLLSCSLTNEPTLSESNRCEQLLNSKVANNADTVSIDLYELTTCTSLIDTFDLTYGGPYIIGVTMKSQKEGIAYSELLQKIKTVKENEIYQNYRNKNYNEYLIKTRVAKAENWKRDSLLFVELKMPHEFVKGYTNFLKKNADGKKTHMDLIEAYRYQSNRSPKINWSNQKACTENLANYNYDQNKWQHVKYEFYKRKSTGQLYMLRCVLGHGPDFDSLEFKVDLNSYKDFGSYATDKHLVFYKFLTSDGLLISTLEKADKNSFTPLGTSMYAKDKNHVYYWGNVIENADVNSFEVIDFDKGPPLAKDKNHVYNWDKILEDTTQINGLKEYLLSKK